MAKITDEQAYKAVAEAKHFGDAARNVGRTDTTLRTQYWRHIARTGAPEITVEKRNSGSSPARIVAISARHIDGGAIITQLALATRWPDAQPGDRVRVEWEKKDAEGRDTILLTRLREDDER